MTHLAIMRSDDSRIIRCLLIISLSGRFPDANGHAATERREAVEKFVSSGRVAEEGSTNVAKEYRGRRRSIRSSVFVVASVVCRFEGDEAALRCAYSVGLAPLNRFLCSLSGLRCDDIGLDDTTIDGPALVAGANEPSEERRRRVYRCGSCDCDGSTTFRRKRLGKGARLINVQTERLAGAYWVIVVVHEQFLRGRLGRKVCGPERRKGLDN